MIKSSIYTFFLFAFLVASSQDRHHNYWSKAIVNLPLNEKFKTEIELIHRRQNDFESNNLFDKNLVHATRTWIYYKPNKDVVYGISPFAYFSNYKIIQKESDAVAKPTNEYRFTASLELQHQLAPKFYVVDRTAIEYRAFEGSIDNTSRLRNRLAFRYDFTSNYNLAIGDEILINTTGTDALHIFDQNRIFTNFSYKLNSSVKLDLGYIYISRLPQINVDLIDDNNFYLNFTYTFNKTTPAPN